MANNRLSLYMLRLLFRRKAKRSFLKQCETNICLEGRLPRKLKFKFMLGLLALVICNSTVERTIWQKQRTSAWFYLACTYSEDEWYRNFRISRNTFQFLVDELRIDIIRQDTVMRKAVEVRKKIALFLYFIASTDGYQSLGSSSQSVWGFRGICFYLHS